MSGWGPSPAQLLHASAERAFRGRESLEFAAELHFLRALARAVHHDTSLVRKGSEEHENRGLHLARNGLQKLEERSRGMMDVHRILVGLDGSPREAGVLSAAQDLAIRYEADLILLRAIGMPPEVPPEAWQSPDLTVREYLEKHARTAVQGLQRTLVGAVGSRSRVEVVVAAPWEAICTQASVHKADLIVIGSHGYGALDRFLGTTAARVANQAPCSVFVVRAPVPASH